MEKEYSVLVGGEAGQGSRKLGLLIGKLFSSYGYNVFIYDDYQSLIRGGHNFSQIRASEKKVLTHREKVDFLLALDELTVKQHIKQLKKGGIIIYNSDRISLSQKNAVGIGAETVARRIGAPLTANTVLFSAFAKTIGINWSVLEKFLRKEFHKFQEENIKVAKEGFEKAQKKIEIKKIGNIPKPLLTGNEALSLGAVRAGLDLYIAYPMTPASGILHYLSANRKKFGVKVAQLENEVGIANTALGAVYAGARTMVGTSGGGFALMTEALSLACQAELPLMIVESQRPSPASGVPTYTAQGDLLFVLTAGHGDFVRFVCAPGDAEEAYYWAGKLLNLSWKYQTPSILLVDKEISESTFTFDEKAVEKIKKEEPLLWDKKGEYLRYKITKNGISPLAFPGEKDVVVKANSYEHDEFGITVDEEDKVEEMQSKRLRKFALMKKEIEKLKAVNVYGKKNAKKAIIVWGSTKGPAKEIAEKKGIKMIQPVVLEPFPEKEMKKALQGVKKVAVIETNGLSQLGKILNCYQIKVDKKILKYDGRPFLPEEIERKLAGF